MEPQIFTQKGTAMLYIFVPVILLLVSITAFLQLSGPPFYIILFTLLVLLAFLLVFYKLTITVTSEFVAFAFGTGLIKKRYALSEIKSCKPVKNPILYGIGIRFIPNGMLYNVSGTQAVELQFKNRKSIVRIGTNQPDEVCRAIMQHLQPNSNPVELSEKPSRIRSYFIYGTIIFSLAVVSPAALIFYGTREPNVNIEQNNLKIEGIYSRQIPLHQIAAIDTVQQLPSIKWRTNGFAFGSSKSGYFKCSENREMFLYVNTNSVPFIFIETVNQSTIYLNFKSPEKTRELFNNIKKQAKF